VGHKGFCRPVKRRAPLGVSCAASFDPRSIGRTGRAVLARLRALRPDSCGESLNDPELETFSEGPVNKELPMDREHDISVLNSLITTTIDSAKGFEHAAEHADAGRFAQMFRDFANERRQVVALLQQTVRALGGTPNDDGSLKADLHRRWIDLRDALARGGDREIIEEVERGEDYLKAKYDAALADDKLSPVAADAIRKAYQSVRAGHDRASQLKHSMEGASA
jgi:uncharacterized protein (TIGR02284 family)